MTQNLASLAGSNSIYLYHSPRAYIFGPLCTCWWPQGCVGLGALSKIRTFSIPLPRRSMSKVCCFRVRRRPTVFCRCHISQISQQLYTSYNGGPAKTAGPASTAPDKYDSEMHLLLLTVADMHNVSMKSDTEKSSRLDSTDDIVGVHFSSTRKSITRMSYGEHKCIWELGLAPLMHASSRASVADWNI